MSDEAVPPVSLESLDRLESLVGRLEQAAADIAASQEKLSRAMEAQRHRDRTAALDAWRRGY
jgi:exonuclease VII small subunit